MSIYGIEDWLGTPQGQYVMTWEREKINAVIDDLFGYNALQLGQPQLKLLEHSRIPLRQTAGAAGAVNIMSDLRELPFASGSIDLVVMPHALEFHDDPHQILRDVERILIPGGRLVITGFNPMSLWGLYRKLPGHPHASPFNGNYLSVPRLKDWLKLLNLEVDRGNFGCYAPPLQQEKALKRWHFMETAGDRWWSFAGGVYLLRAIKRVRGMHLIMPTRTTARSGSKVLQPLARKHEESGKRGN